MKGLQKRFRVDGSHVWYIDKRVRRYGRLCESTGTDNLEEAVPCPPRQSPFVALL